MALFSHLRSWFREQAGKRPSPRRQWVRPTLEILEDRLALNNGVPTPDHVVVVMMENHSYSDIIGNSSAPYINALATGPNAALFTQSYAIEHPSQPNYLDLFSGSNQGVTSDSTPTNLPFSTPNLGAELLQQGLTFTTYSEDLPSVGFTGNITSVPKTLKRGRDRMKVGKGGRYHGYFLTGQPTIARSGSGGVAFARLARL